MRLNISLLQTIVLWTTMVSYTFCEIDGHIWLCFLDCLYLGVLETFIEMLS